MGWRMLRQVLPVAGNFRQFLGLYVVQRVSERHLPAVVMVAIGFSIGRDVDQFRP